MKNKILIIFILSIIIFPFIIEARSGCCSWHGGVCGCGCCDGTPLSATCAPYYPQCGSSQTKTLECPLMSYYDSLSDSCKCISGYIVQNNSCVNGNTYCKNNYASGSNYNIISKKCECSYGEFVYKNKCISYNNYCKEILGNNAKYNTIKNSCECLSRYIYDGNKCISETSYCKNSMGLFSKYNSIEKKCECMSGYEYNGKTCIHIEKISCPDNAHLNIDNKCYCDDGYEINGNGCVTHTQGCQLLYGINSYGNEEFCYCSEGYEWNSTKTSCIVKITCPINSQKINNQCICDNDYVMINNTCITHTKDCQNRYGEHSYGQKDNNNSFCYCSEGYEWNSTKTSCIQQKQNTIEKEDKISKLKTNLIVEETQKSNTKEKNNAKNSVKIEEISTENAFEQISGDFNLIGNEKIRACGSLDCRVVKFGSTGIATILEENENWFKIRINDNGEIIEGWINSSLVPNSIKNKKQKESNNSIDNQTNISEIKKSENIIIKFLKNLFHLFKK